MVAKKPATKKKAAKKVVAPAPAPVAVAVVATPQTLFAETTTDHNPTA